MRETILELKNITKIFPGTIALDKVNFDLRKGEIHALIGENGAGKSTLIKIISGILLPNSGEIYLDGKLVNISNPLIAQHYGIAAIQQEPTIFPDLNVAENVFMGHMEYDRFTKRLKWKKMYEATEKLLKALEVKLNPREKVKNLSIANQQLVEIVKALSLNSRILIMDEPTSALTLHEVDELFGIIKQLQNSGTSIIYISHRIEETFEIADRVTVLRDGHYIGTRNVSETNVDELIRMMIGRTLSNIFPKTNIEKGETVLKVESLTKEDQFNNISFELHKGEILGFAGLVGAGRTEVARAIFGLETNVYGNIFINNEKIHIKSPSAALAHGIAYLPEDRQQQGLILPMDITKNITLPILDKLVKLGWLNNDREITTAKKYATMLDVKAPGLWQKVLQLSGGNQQKVVLAKWLATNPKVLILDEPTKGIDVGAKAAVHKFMNELASHGLGIMMISSELPEILGMSDRIVVMCEGRITAVFERNEATQDKILSAAIGLFSNNVKKIG